VLSGTPIWKSKKKEKEYKLREQKKKGREE
jgi:hypothetical protein